MPLLGCCSDAPGYPGKRLVICGDQTFFQLSSSPCPKSTWKKMLHFCKTSWPKIKPFASFLSGLGLYNARLPFHRESANFFLKNHYILPGGARWLSGRVSDSGARGRGFDTYRCRVVSLSKTLYSPKVLVNYPGSGGSVPIWLKNCWLGR